MMVKFIEEKIPGSFSQTGEIDRLINYELIAFSPVNSTFNPNNKVFLAPLVVDSDRDLNLEADNGGGIVLIPQEIVAISIILRLGCMAVRDNVTIVNTGHCSVKNLELNAIAVLLQRLELTGKVSLDFFWINSDEIHIVVLVEVSLPMSPEDIVTGGTNRSPIIELDKVEEGNRCSVINSVCEYSRTLRLNINRLQELNIEGVVLQRHISTALLVEDSHAEVDIKCRLEELGN